MSDIIHLLPDSVANQIAAGEVVQRPSSVVKELLENSIDAGATHVELWLTDAGKTCIQVVDNGKGMTETDARLSFERHATSKITKADDLFNLRTMGFRGEALASIAAVAQVELVTRTQADDMGISITIEGARCVDQHPVACPVGANFMVRNLFYNVPARRRFLKSNVTEMNNVMQEFERVAMINPGVSFKLYRDETLSLDLRAGSFKQRILALFGNAFDKQLLPVSVDTNLVKIEGFAASPQSAKVKGFKQFIFVNGRYMRHPYFNKAVLAAYERLIPADKQVSFFLQLTVDPQQIDVNIHPTKTEIKFEDDRAIWQIILVAVKDALGKFNAVPTIDFEASPEMEIPAFNPNIQTHEPRYQGSSDYNPFESGASMPSYRQAKTEGWQSLYDFDNLVGASDAPKKADSTLFADDSFDKEAAADAQPAAEAMASQPAQGHYMSYGTRYIITPAKSGIMVIDFVRAHRRILYDKFLRSMMDKDCVTQRLLFPQLIQMTMTQSLVMDTMLDELNAVGFDISSVGGGSYAVNGVPAAAANVDAEALMQRLAEDYDQGAFKTDDLYHTIALALARSNSMREGHTLDVQEMTSIVNQLFACQTPGLTPDGKTIISIIEADSIDKMFR